MPRGTGIALGIALALLASGWALTTLLFPGWILPLGFLDRPSPGLAAFAGLWAIFGSAAAVAIAVAFERGGIATRLRAELEASSAGSWILGGAVFALLAAVAVRVGLLHGQALTDDEASYRFAAQLLASGRLSVPSPEGRIFFDHPFLFNDGRWSSIYFLGWPALAAPSIWLGATGFANALFHALTVPPVFLTARRLAGELAARAAVVLFLSSPFLLVLAGTELSHSSGIAALAWALWCYLRTREAEAPVWAHATLATLLAAAFWIRPQAAIGVGGAIGLLWLRDRLRERAFGGRALAAFALPVLVLGGLFLAAQNELHGSPWTTGYEHARRYHAETGYRFTPLTAASFGGTIGYDAGDLGGALARTAGGAFRLGVDLFGWPCGLLLLGFAIGARGAGTPGLLLAGGLAAVLFQRDSGVDSFGPVHWAELSLPVVLLAASIVARPRTEPAAGAGLPRPGALVAAAIVVAWSTFVPVRWITLGRIVENIRAPLAAVDEVVRGPAILFAPFPWVRPDCLDRRAAHFRMSRPVGDPDLADERLWVNHVDLARDRQLAASFPDRRAWAISWSESCRPVVLPLEVWTEEKLPPARPLRN